MYLFQLIFQVSFVINLQLVELSDGSIAIKQSDRLPLRLLATQLLVLLFDIEHRQLTLEQLHQAYMDR